MCRPSGRFSPPPPSVEAGTHRVSLDVRPTRGFDGGAPGGRPAPPPPADACHPPSPTAANNPPPQVATRRRPREAGGLSAGSYTVRLTVDGETLHQPVTLKPDPRNLPEGSESNAFSGNNN